MPLPTLSSKKRTIYLSILLIILIFITAYFTLLSPSNPSSYELSSRFKSLFNPESANTSSKPTPQSSPKVLPTGEQTYHYSHGSDVKGPKLQTVTISPFDPQLGEIIKVTTTIKHDSPVTRATIILVTDNKTITQKMKLISGEAVDGTWETNIKLNDTYLYTYQLNFNLKSQTNNYQGGMTFRP